MSSPMPVVGGMCAVCFDPIAVGEHAVDEEGKWDIHTGVCAIETGLAEPVLNPLIDLHRFAVVELPSLARKYVRFLSCDLAKGDVVRARKVVGLLELVVAAQEKAARALVDRGNNVAG